MANDDADDEDHDGGDDEVHDGGDDDIDDDDDDEDPDDNDAHDVDDERNLVERSDIDTTLGLRICKLFCCNGGITFPH